MQTDFSITTSYKQETHHDGSRKGFSQSARWEFVLTTEPATQNKRTKYKVSTSCILIIVYFKKNTLVHFPRVFLPANEYAKYKKQEKYLESHYATPYG